MSKREATVRKGGRLDRLRHPMIGTLLLSALLLAANAALASAAGLNLGWGECAGLGAGQANRSFACDTDSGGGHVLVGSFLAPAGLTKVTGWAVVIDLQTPGPTLSPWWQIGVCRPTNAALHSADFTAGPFGCVDYSHGGMFGGGAYILPPIDGGTNRARIKQGWALPANSPAIGPIRQGDEVYAWKCTITNTKTVGPGSCSGCSNGACIVFNEIVITQSPGAPEGDQTVNNPALRSHVTWNGGGGLSCPGARPSQNARWGRIRTFYR